MKKTLPLLLLIVVLVLSACAPQATPGPTSPPAETSTPVATAAPTAVPTSALPPKQYTNSTFKFGFMYPSTWFGPDEYVSGDTLRVAVGSDVVYPYGEQPETPSNVKNSYNVVIQYTKNLPADYSNDTYGLLANLKDGESLSGPRNLTIRVRELHIGKFDGFEYISTLSETAQTEHLYLHEVLLMDPQTKDLITIMAQPINVEITDATKWRDTYKSIDEANLPVLYQIIESITVE